MPKIALLDLGTNTFHLLIVDTDAAAPFAELHRSREFVKLAEDGIEKLGVSAWRRGLETISRFRKTIDQFDVDDVKAVGTAAIRTAENGKSFIKTIEEIAGIEVDLIDGSQEAELIYRGVSKIWHLEGLPALIMDIGGGSVEFIIADGDGIKWARSYPIGVAVLFRNHHSSDPISQSEQLDIQAFLKPYFEELLSALNQYQPLCLIGASGTFDVLLTFERAPDAAFCRVDIDQIKLHLSSIIKMNLESRKQDPRIPPTRVDMIVVAALLIQMVLNLHPFDQMRVSQYALKEGLF